MSIKIYDAFRIQDGVDLWPFLWRVRDQAQALAGQRLREHYLELVNEMDPSDRQYRKERRIDRERPEHSFRLLRAHRIVQSGYEKNTTSMVWDRYSLDISIALYPHSTGNYLRAFCQAGSVMGGVLGFLNTCLELDDFHYQDSADRPRKVLDKDWDNRRRVWEDITAQYRDIGNHVTLEIVSWGNFHLMDPWHTIAREWHENPPRLPPRYEVFAQQLRALKKYEKVWCGDGVIAAEPGRVRVERVKRGLWTSIIGGVTLEHKSMAEAFNHVYLESLSPSMKSAVLHLMGKS